MSRFLKEKRKINPFAYFRTKYEEDETKHQSQFSKGQPIKMRRSYHE